MGNTQGSGSPPNSSRGRRRDRDSSWLNKSRTENRSGFLRQSSALSTTALNMLRNKDAQLKVVNQYRIVKQIGRGSFGEVFLATTRDGTRYAMKMLRKSALRRQRQGQFGSALDNVKAEIALMKKIRHPNCVQMIEVIDDESADEVFIILEFVDGGSSQATGRDGRQVPLKEGLIWSHLRHLVVGLEYLHMNGIAHRDIKPDNLLVSKREGNMLKIGDFGTALFTEAGDATKTAGTPAFFAPEMCDTEREGGFDPLACDMWAVGVTLHMWAYGRPPFSEPTPMLIMQAIRDCPDVVPQPQDERKVSEGLKSIMSGLLTKRPDRRLTLNLLRRHPWLTRDGAEPIPEQPIVIVEVSATDVANAITPLLQVSGHEGAVERDGAASIVKQTTVQEKDFYEALAASDIAAFAPVLYGIKSDAGPADFHIREEAPEGGAPIRLSIQDLTAGMQSPCVMDVKMGVRTTLEEELADDFPRPDLLRKMARAALRPGRPRRDKPRGCHADRCLSPRAPSRAAGLHRPARGDPRGAPGRGHHQGAVPPVPRFALLHEHARLPRGRSDGDPLAGQGAHAPRLQLPGAQGAGGHQGVLRRLLPGQPRGGEGRAPQGGVHAPGPQPVGLLQAPRARAVIHINHLRPRDADGGDRPGARRRGAHQHHAAHARGQDDRLCPLPPCAGPQDLPPRAVDARLARGWLPHGPRLAHRPAQGGAQEAQLRLDGALPGRAAHVGTRSARSGCSA